jgi:signal transduction histidine kinase
MSDSDPLQASRARLAAAALADRRRFERALHDGVQQDLIALSVGLQLLRERADVDEAVDELRTATRETLERVRALADEIYPSVLDAQGLVGAPRRYPPEVEAAVALSEPTSIREENGRLVVELRSAAVRDLLEAVGADVTVQDGQVRAEFAL